MRSCLQVVNGVKHDFHSLVCNPVGFREQRERRQQPVTGHLLTKKDSQAQDQLEVSDKSVVPSREGDLIKLPDRSRPGKAGRKTE